LDDVDMMEIDYDDLTTSLCKHFAGMKIEDQDTQQSMDLEYIADGNGCFDDVDMMEIDYDDLTTYLCQRFAAMKIEDQDTQQSMYLE
jgi:peroxiredoxin